MARCDFTDDQIAECLEIDLGAARKLSRYIKTARSASDVDEVFQRAKELIAEGPGYGTFDVEALWSAEDWDEILGIYLNVGDQYACTLCYDERARKFFVTDWESFTDYLVGSYGEIHQ